MAASVPPDRQPPVLARERLLWAVWVRWLVIGGFLALVLVAHGLGLFASVVPCLWAAALGALVNGANDWCVRRQRHVVAVTAVAVPLDHVFITYVVLHTGGIQSPLLMLYVVQVLATAMLVDTRVAAASACLAIALWTGAVSGQAAGYLATPVLFRPGAPPPVALYHAVWAAFLLYCLSLLVYLGGYISARLRASEQGLVENNRRLAEALASLRETHAALQAAYARLQQAEAHLVQSEKMRSLGQLVAGVAHELNNPISFISANVEHLRAAADRLRQLLAAYAAVELPAAEAQRLVDLRRALRVDALLADLPALLDDCEEGARRTKQIVHELRAFSRSDEHEDWQLADLHRGIDGSLGLLAHRLSDRIAIHRDFGDVPHVECLPGPLNQVFMNLLANAADAIGTGAGNIWIATRVLPGGASSGADSHRKPPTPLAAAGAGERADAGDACTRSLVSIAIRDDGQGMSPEVRARILEPFFTTKPVGQGTGLGLSVSYGIVQRHDGTLTVDSTPGRGTTLTVTLPIRRCRAPDT